MANSNAGNILYGIFRQDSNPDLPPIFASYNPETGNFTELFTLSADNLDRETAYDPLTNTFYVTNESDDRIPGTIIAIDIDTGNQTSIALPQSFLAGDSKEPTRNLVFASDRNLLYGIFREDSNLDPIFASYNPETGNFTEITTLSAGLIFGYAAYDSNNGTFYTFGQSFNAPGTIIAIDVDTGNQNLITIPASLDQVLEIPRGGPSLDTDHIEGPIRGLHFDSSRNLLYGIYKGDDFPTPPVFASYNPQNQQFSEITTLSANNLDFDTSYDPKTGTFYISYEEITTNGISLGYTSTGTIIAIDVETGQQTSISLPPSFFAGSDYSLQPIHGLEVGTGGGGFGTSPLIIEADNGDFTDNNNDGIFTAPQGSVIFIGHEGGIRRMLRIVDSITVYDKNCVTITGGTVFSEIGGVTEPLFTIDGSLTLPFYDPSTAGIIETGNNTIKEFKLAGLDYNVASIAIFANEFRLGGNFAIPASFAGQPFGISLNQPDTVIFRQNDIRLGASGSVEFPDRNFTIFELLEVETSDLEISYTAPIDTLKIQGEVELKPFVKNTSIIPEITANVTNNNSIQIVDGKVGGRVTFEVEDISPAKGWEIGGSVTIDRLINSNPIEGTGFIKFPFAGKKTRRKNKQSGLAFNLEFVTQPTTELNFVEGIVKFPVPIPVFTTGFFVNQVNGRLNNLAPSNPELVEFGGGVRLTGGAKVSKIGLINVDLNGTVNAEEVTGQGRISIINPAIIQGTTRATLNWNTGTFKAISNVSIYGGLLKGTASFATDSSFNFVMRGTATLNVPFFIPHISGEKIAGANLLFKSSNDNNLANDFVQAWANISNPLGSLTGQKQTITVGVRQSLNSILPEFLGIEVPITGSWDVEPNTSYLLVSANWENPTDANRPIQVIDNNGNIIAEEDFAANNIAVVEDLTDENTKTVIIANPEAGRWDVELVSTEGLGEVTYFASRDSDAPTIEIIEPSQTVPGGEVEITFDAFDADSEANISLFYDDDGEGFDGIQIVDGLIEQDGRGNYIWNTAGVATGEYHIYAIALDDTNAPAFSYSPGTVQITQAADLNVTQTVDRETTNIRESQIYTITVTNNGEDTATGVTVDYTLPEGATFISATLEPSAKSEDDKVQFIVGNLAKDESTTIEVTINTSNILGEALANTTVTSDSYDPDITNNIADTITNVTNNGLPVVDISDVSAIEGNEGTTSLTFTASLSTETTEAFSIEYSTEDLTAFAGEDYTATEGILEFAPGELEKTITVDILGDTNPEEDEIFSVTFNSSDDNFVLTKPRAIGTIQTDDGDNSNGETDTDGSPNPATGPIPVPTTPTSKLRVSLVESKSSFVNELAVFTVDDAAGTINGFVPGTEGYAQQALDRASSIFSTITYIPKGFDSSNLSGLIEFDTTSNSNLQFMLVRNSTLSNVKNGITPISELLFSDISLQQITDSADGSFSLDWKDSSGNATDFKDLVLKGEVTTDSLPPEAAIQSESGIEIIDLRNAPTSSETLEIEFSVYREAAFNNYVGFYKINDTEGSITDSLTGNILKPGDAGYIQTAVGNRVAGVDLEVANQSVKTLSGEFTSDSLFAPFIITNASPTEVLDTDTENDPAVYFPFLNANADGVDHIRLLANNVFGFEDLPNGGDLDYNDMVITANLKMS